MALGFADRMLTIAVTATLTSAAWIVAGSEFVRVRETAPAAPPAADEPSAAQAAGALLIPVGGISTGQIGDTFDDERGERRHEALDIAAPLGAPVIAAAGGKVEKLFASDDGGNTVYVRSGDRRTLYYYAHLHAYAPGLQEGQSVERGQRLGTVGSTGNADPAAPHLHFAVMRMTADAEWWEPGIAINPYPLLVARY